MVRNPCCEKMGVKKGPWTPQEDEILVSYIRHFGHDNWRALPRQAGLLRCGKSCRLRWNNYLRPDIKRGNFTLEEEETISNLHQLLGNRWSAIATKLPGRTDNEIKNLWHTRLKKRDKEMSKSVPHGATIFLNSMKIEVPRQKICDSPTSSSDHQMIQIAPMHQQQPVVLHQNHHINVINNSELIANEAEQEGGHNFQKLHYQNSDVSNENMVFWYNVLKNAGNSLN